MLDQKKIRNSPEEISELLKRRNYTFNLSKWNSLDGKRKKIQIETEDLQSSLNNLSKQIGILKGEKKETKHLEKEAALTTKSIKKLSGELVSILEHIEDFLLDIPNLPDDDVPEGEDESQNKEVRKWGRIPKFNFTPKDHVEIGKISSSIDLEGATIIAGSRFMVLKNKYAKLQRSLIQFMMDIHLNKHSYEEVYVPYIVNKESLVGTGQLPKFEEDLFQIEGNQKFYLSPTAEVPVTNLLRDKIVDSKDLPIKWVCHTPCFRREAGSYGKDTKGIMRLHQFEKVELVQAVEPEDSDKALEELTCHAEAILQALEIPYRVVSLCTADLGFSASKTYDIEAWIPSQNTYREISSCTNFRDFQARRIKARWKDTSTNKTELLNTINGSGLAIGRTLIALVENHQTKEGDFKIPKALKNYF